MSEGIKKSLASIKENINYCIDRQDDSYVACERLSSQLSVFIRDISRAQSLDDVKLLSKIMSIERGKFIEEIRYRKEEMEESDKNMMNSVHELEESMSHLIVNDIASNKRRIIKIPRNHVSVEWPDK